MWRILLILDRCERAGLSLCYPAVSQESTALRVHDAFDLALAHKLVSERAIRRSAMISISRIRNAFLSSPVRIKGGKTTFARMFGQLHYLASLGCLVPGRSARLFLPDRILTHFEREETISDLRGKLQDDLIRIHEALRQATPRSVIVMNEIFGVDDIAGRDFSRNENHRADHRNRRLMRLRDFRRRTERC